MTYNLNHGNPRPETSLAAIELGIDHVMIDGRVDGRDGRVLDAGVSDHRPVVVTLEARRWWRPRRRPGGAPLDSPTMMALVLGSRRWKW